MNTNVVKAAGMGILAAMMIGGAILAGTPRTPAAEACVLRAQESGACVIAGRPARETSFVSGEAAATFPRGEGMTEEYHVEERLAVGILPERAENVVRETAEAEPLQSPAATASPEGKPEGARYLGTYKITGYDTCSRCCGKSDGVTASGTQATVGRTCAAPATFAFGTRLWIDGLGERVVEDRGGGVNGQHIDVLCADHPACYAITGSYDVYILED